MIMVEGNKYALVVGSAQYDNHRQFDDLSFCETDGEGMAAVLRSQNYSIPRRNVLIGRVTGKKLHDRIVHFFNDDNLNKNDTVIFYFSGHGVISPRSGEVYLCPADIDGDNPSKDGFSFRELATMMNESLSKNVIAIIDSCYSGNANISNKSDAKLGAYAADHITKETEKIRQTQGKVILCASLGFQESQGSLTRNVSFFTHHVIEGLKGANGQSVDKTGTVTPGTLVDYIGEKFSTELKKLKQTPIFKIETTGKIILADHKNKWAEKDILTFLSPKLRHLKSKKTNSPEEHESLLELMLGFELSQSSYHKRETYSWLFDSSKSKHDIQNLKTRNARLQNNDTWKFHPEQLDIENHTRWYGIPLESNEGFFRMGYFSCKFQKQGQKFTGASTDYLTGDKTTMEISEENTGRYGKVLYCKYTSPRSYMGYYELYKFIDKNTIIGKSFKGNFPGGKELYTYALAKKYAIDFMSDEDHQMLFSISRPVSLQLLKGVWKGEVVNDTISSFPNLMLKIRKNKNNLTCKLFIEDQKFSDDINSDEQTPVITSHTTSFFKTIRKINDDLIIGKTRFSKNSILKKYPNIEEYTKLADTGIELKWILKRIS